MKTFNEKLQFYKSKLLMKETFFLMQQNGINPNLFIDWYLKNGIYFQEENLLKKEANNWLQHTIYLNEGFFDNEQEPNQNPLQQQIDLATKAVDNLLQRMQRSKNKDHLLQSFKNPRFQEMLISLKNMLISPDKIFNQTNQESAPETIATESNNFNNYIKNIQLYKNLNRLEKEGINPKSFFEWYVEEGQHLNEGWWDQLKDFGARTWQNIKNGWNNFRSGSAGNQWQTKTDAKRDNEAVKTTMDSLAQLAQQGDEQLNNDFTQHVQEILNNLHAASTNPVPESSAQEPTSPQTQTPITSTPIAPVAQAPVPTATESVNENIFFEYIKRRSL